MTIGFGNAVFVLPPSLLGLGFRRSPCCLEILLAGALHVFCPLNVLTNGGVYFLLLSACTPHSLFMVGQFQNCLRRRFNIGEGPQ